MITIHHKDNFISERKYIYEVILRDILGISYNLVAENRNNVLLEFGGKSIEIADHFFQMQEDCYLQVSSLPIQPLKEYDVEVREFTSNKLPMIYGDDKADYLLLEEKNHIRISIDIFGSAFFMLTRYEELVQSKRDEWGRFSAYDSLAYKAGFLERPLINEYIELLWLVIHKLWPHLQRKNRNFAIIPTHDVDVPFELAFLSIYQLLHTLAGDLIKRRSWITFSKRLSSIMKVKMGNLLADVNYTFNDIMNFSEAQGLKSRFYFMTAQNVSTFDGNYKIDHPAIVELLKNINSRGHEIGIHPSFSSYKDGERIKKDVHALRKVLKDNAMTTASLGGRQHYLRWAVPETWQYYEDAGLTYDTTLSFADYIGFRCGICYEYHPFNLVTRQKMNLLEYPLIVMECSGLDEKYMNLSHQAMLTRCLKLKEQCKKYNGNFVILWHNSMFKYAEDAVLYKKIILE